MIYETLRMIAVLESEYNFRFHAYLEGDELVLRFTEIDKTPPFRYSCRVHAGDSRRDEIICTWFRWVLACEKSGKRPELTLPIIDDR